MKGVFSFHVVLASLILARLRGKKGGLQLPQPNLHFGPLEALGIAL